MTGNRLARDLWRFAIHSACKDCSAFKRAMLVYASSEMHDDEAPYIPHRLVGRPRIKWDDRLRAFFAQHFPHRISEHWTEIIRSVEVVGLEVSFIDFCIGI